MLNPWTARQVDVESAEWRSMLERSEHMLFHEPAWARVTKRGFNGESIAVVFEKDGMVHGGMLGFTFRSLWAKLLYFNFPYGGVIGDAPDDAEIARLLREIAGRLGIARIRLTSCPELRPVAPRGFDHVEMRTHILDLSGGDYELLWNGFKSRVRRDVRKSERSGVTVSRAASASDVSVFYDLYLQAMKRNGAIPKYGIGLVEALFEELGPLDRCAILLAWREKQAIAGVLVVDSATMSHYLLGGAAADGLQYCPNDLLLHHSIRRAVKKGLHGFDFLPSGVGDEALERFKTKWGSKPHPISVYTAVTRPATMLAWDAAYRIAESRLGAVLVAAVRGR